jgi:hypothetical protein
MNYPLNLKVSTTSLSLIAAFVSASLGATDLPPAFKAEIEAMAGVTIGPDGGIKVGNKIYIPLLPANYNAATSTMKLADLLPLPDGSVAAGGIQFAPITLEPGSLPKLPDNFTPIAGNSLPADFAPPAGFIPSASAPLPAGVVVPAKTPADMVKDLEDAGTFPKGFVTFNPDGSITSSGQTFMPFAPSADKQGKFDATSGRSSTMTLVDGVVTFPDGTQMVPLVAGKTPGSKTLPSTFTPLAGTALPKEVNLPPQFDIPRNMPLPPGVTLPPGVNIPSDYEFMIPPGTVMPAGSNIPAGVRASPDVLIPPGLIMPPGTDVTTANLPAGTVFLPNGSIIVPGTSIPRGMAPPASWIPPSGVVINADGGYDVPPPPPGGYPTPPAPLNINADGSMVMADGTNFRPPLFVGKVGDDGVLSNAGFSMSADYVPAVRAGVAVTATKPSTMDKKTGAIRYEKGSYVPPDAVENEDGSFGTEAPKSFRPSSLEDDGKFTLRLEAGDALPQGAKLNPDGTFTFDANDTKTLEVPPFGGTSAEATPAEATSAEATPAEATPAEETSAEATSADLVLDPRRQELDRFQKLDKLISEQADRRAITDKLLSSGELDGDAIDLLLQKDRDADDQFEKNIAEVMGQEPLIPDDAEPLIPDDGPT